MSCVAMTHAPAVNVDTRDVLLWTTRARADAQHILQAFCWAKEANMPWLLHEEDGLRGAHIAIIKPTGLSLLHVLRSSPACRPAGDLDCEATQLVCTSGAKQFTVSLTSDQFLDRLPLAGSTAPGRNGIKAESLLDLLPAPMDQRHIDARSWHEAAQQVAHGATAAGVLQAANAWLRLVWLEAAYEYLQPVYAILAANGKRLSVLQPLVAAIHASSSTQIPQQDQQQQQTQQQHLQLLQELLPGCPHQELQQLLNLAEKAVTNLHPPCCQLKQQLIALFTEKLQGRRTPQQPQQHVAQGHAPAPTAATAGRAAVQAEGSLPAEVAASTKQKASAAAAAASGKRRISSTGPGSRSKRPLQADAIGSVSKKQRQGIGGDAALGSHKGKGSLTPGAQPPSKTVPLPKQQVSAGRTPAEASAGVDGASQKAQFATEQQAVEVQHPDNISSEAAPSIAAAAPPSGATAGVRVSPPGVSVKLPALRSPGGARRPSVGRPISIRLAVDSQVARAEIVAAAAAAAVGGGGSVGGVTADQQQLEATHVSAAVTSRSAQAADAPAGAAITPGRSSKPQQLAEPASEQQQQQPVTAMEQQQQHHPQPHASIDTGAGSEGPNKASSEVCMPQQPTRSKQQQQQKQESGGDSARLAPAVVEQSAAAGLAAGAATGVAGGVSVDQAMMAVNVAAVPASSRLVSAADSQAGGGGCSTVTIKREMDSGLESVATASGEGSLRSAGAAAAGSSGIKSEATKGLPVDMLNVSTPAAQAAKVSSLAASGAAAGSDNKPAGEAVPRAGADTAAAAAADLMPAADPAQGAPAARHGSASSSARTALAADITNLCRPASSGAAAAAPRSKTAPSPVSSPAEAPVDGRERAVSAKRARIPTPGSATTDRSTSRSAATRAASGAADCSDAPRAAKRARIPIPKPPTVGHSDQAGLKHAAAAGPASKPDSGAVDERYLLTLFDDFVAVQQNLKDAQRSQVQHTNTGTLVQLHWYMHYVDDGMKKQLRDDEHALTFLRKYPAVFRLQYPPAGTRAGDVMFGLQPGSEKWLREHLLASVQPLLRKYKASLKQAILAAADGQAPKQGPGIPFSAAGTLVKDRGYMLPELYAYTKLYPTFRSFVEAVLCDDFSIMEPSEGRQRQLVLRQPPPPPPPVSRPHGRQDSGQPRRSSNSDRHRQGEVLKQQQGLAPQLQRPISASPPPELSHDQAAVAPVEEVTGGGRPPAATRFEQLVADYRARLREHLQRMGTDDDYQGVELGFAGNPSGHMISRELLAMCKRECGSFGSFIEQYLSDDFEVVAPDADQPGHTVLVLRSTFRSSTPSQQPPPSPQPLAAALSPDGNFGSCQHQGIYVPEQPHRSGAHYTEGQCYQHGVGSELDVHLAHQILPEYHTELAYQQEDYDTATAGLQHLPSTGHPSDHMPSTSPAALGGAEVDPRFLQLLSEWKARLKEYILQQEPVNGWRGANPAKAGAPRRPIMTPELFEYKNKLHCSGMRDFIEKFASDQFKLVHPDPENPGRSLIVLLHNSKKRQPRQQPAPEAAAAGPTGVEDQTLEYLSPYQQQHQQQLGGTLSEAVSQEQLFAEQWNDSWLDPVLDSTGAAGALSSPFGSIWQGPGSGQGAGLISQPPPPPLPRAAAAAGDSRRFAAADAGTFRHVPSSSAELGGLGSVSTPVPPSIPAQLEEDLDLAIIATFLQHAKKQQQTAIRFLEEGELSTTLEVTPVTGLSREDQQLIDSLGTLSMPCSDFTERLLQTSHLNVSRQRELLSQWLGHLCDSRILIQGLDAVNPATPDVSAEASMSMRLGVAAMSARLLKHTRLQALIPQIEQALVNRLSSKATKPGHLGVPRLEVGESTQCLRENVPHLRPYLLLPGFLRDLVRESSLRSSFWYGPSIKPPSLKQKRAWFVEIRVPVAQARGFLLGECVRVKDSGTCKYDDHCFFGHVRSW